MEDKNEPQIEKQHFDEAKLVVYEKQYSEPGLWEKIRGNLKTAGAETLYKAMQLYYATQNPDCPPQVKATIYGALGYFLAPLDFVPDLLPGLGYTDDLAAISFALVVANLYVNDEVRAQARAKLESIFGPEAVSSLKD